METPKSLEEMEKLLEVLKKHGVTFFALPGGLQIQILPQMPTGAEISPEDAFQGLNMKDPFTNA